MKIRLHCHAASSSRAEHGSSAGSARADLRTKFLLRWNAILALLLVLLGFSFTSCRRQKDVVKPNDKNEEIRDRPALLYGIPYQVYEQRKSEIKE